MKLLLHACCAPCSVYPLKVLRDEGVTPTVFWYNPNIHPLGEYLARRDCLKEYAKAVGVELVIEDEYGLDEFVCQVNKERGNLLSRCEEYCYPLRLGRVFQYASENGYDAVSTTLLYSIYQKHEVIREMMNGLAEEYGVEFLYRDFRKGWQEGQDEARRAGLYMQKYCGCVYSEEEGTWGRKMRRKLLKEGIRPTNENIRKMLDTPGNQFA